MKNKTPLDKNIDILFEIELLDSMADVQGYVKIIIRDSVKDLKNEIRKLGVKIDKNDKFDFIGVNNAIFSINKHFGTLAEEELK